MTRADALKKIKRVLGPKMTWGEYESWPRGPEQREAAQAALPEARARKVELLEARQARANAILDADSEYQRLKAEAQAAKDELERLQSVANRYRCYVGRVEMGMNFVKAQGDNWADVVAKVVK